MLNTAVCIIGTCTFLIVWLLYVLFNPPIFVFQDHESVVKAIYTGYEFLESVPAGNEVGLVLESTSFYAEQGGQVFSDPRHPILWLLDKKGIHYPRGDIW